MSVTPSPPGREAPIVLIVAKAPVEGRVKTRLAATLGAERATEIAVAMLLDTLEGCRRVFADVGFLCGADADVPLLRELAGSTAPIVVQEGAGLGSALPTGARFAVGRGRAAIMVSSDIPGVPPGALEAAAAHLAGGADVVLGPGHDGGYWLIAMREEHPELFAGIAWSTGSVLDATLARCGALGLDVRLVERWRDIDTADDVAALAEVAETLPGARTRAVLPHLLSPVEVPHKPEVLVP
jgi:rSAM/selenodomain-associated transferase 1